MRTVLATGLKALALVWALVVLAFMAAGVNGVIQGSATWWEAWDELARIHSPLNWLFWMLILLAMSPALGAWALAQRLARASPGTPS